MSVIGTSTETKLPYSELKKVKWATLEELLKKGKVLLTVEGEAKFQIQLVSSTVPERAQIGTSTVPTKAEKLTTIQAIVKPLEAKRPRTYYRPGELCSIMQLPIYDSKTHKLGERVRVFENGKWRQVTVS